MVNGYVCVAGVCRYKHLTGPLTGQGLLLMCERTPMRRQLKNAAHILRSLIHNSSDARDCALSGRGKLPASCDPLVAVAHLQTCSTGGVRQAGRPYGTGCKLTRRTARGPEPPGSQNVRLS
jgi:hypothetical protein